MSKRNETIDAAKDKINNDRAKDYGDALSMHRRIAIGWTQIINMAEYPHGSITPAHVCLMMDWLKTCRLCVTIDHDDSWEDKIGYSALGSEISEAWEKEIPRPPF